MLAILVSAQAKSTPSQAVTNVTTPTYSTSGLTDKSVTGTNENIKKGFTMPNIPMPLIIGFGVAVGLFFILSKRAKK